LDKNGAVVSPVPVAQQRSRGGKQRTRPKHPPEEEQDVDDDEYEEDEYEEDEEEEDEDDEDDPVQQRKESSGGGGSGLFNLTTTGKSIPFPSTRLLTASNRAR
jgi:hypothetical protein